MESVNMQLLVVVCSSIALAGAVCTWAWLSRSGRSRLPPGPAGLPLVGNLHQLGTLPHQTFARLSKIFGPLMSVRLGSLPMVVVSSPAMAMHILHTHDKTFAGRPQHTSTHHLMYTGCPIVLSQPGPYWKLMRQICATDLLTSKALEHSRPLRTQEMRALLLSIFASRESPLSIREMLHTSSCSTMSRMAMGKPLRELASGGCPESGNMASILSELMCLLGEFNVGDYIPALAWMDLQGYSKRSEQVARKLKAMLQAVIDDRRRRKGDDKDTADISQPHDLLDLLLSAAGDTKHEALRIQDSSIRAVLVDMLVAATDSSALTSEWALAELLANPETLSKVEKELQENVEMTRFVKETDIPNLPYLRAVVQETLRLHTITLVPHASSEACNILSYHIPANTAVYINVWAIHRDPSAWDNPLEFRPERFLNNALSDAMAGKQCEFLPFGSGRRSCLGWKLGLLNVQTVLANLLHAFVWTSPQGKPSLDEAANGVAVALKNPLIAVPLPRLPLSLYHTLN